jgi:hypothetical protein
MARSHRDEVARHRDQQAAHEQLKRHHHTIMAQLALLLKSWPSPSDYRMSTVLQPNQPAIDQQGTATVLVAGLSTP